MDNSRLSFFFVFFGLLISTTAWAQPGNDDCATAQQLCSNSSINGSTINATAEVGGADGATATGTFCFDVDNTVWFSFTTNAAGGLATVSIDNISCLVGAGLDQELQAVIVEATTPCDPTTYNAVSNCETGSAGAIGLIAAALNPNTTYYVVIDGDLNGTGITTAAQCDFSIEVSGPAVDVTITAATQDQTCGNTDGEINVTGVDGAPGPYEYSIDGANYQTGTVFSNLAAGTYTITVKDAAGCEHYHQVTIGLTGGPDNANANVTDVTDCNTNDGSIQITGVSGGTVPYSYSINGGTAQTSNTFNNLGAGLYTITIFDAFGCPYSLQVEVDDPTDVWDVNATSTQADCGQNNGTIDVTVNTGGAAPYSFALNGGAGQANGNFTGLAAGGYTVTITDANGCIYDVFIPVAQNPTLLIPEVTITASPNPACDGDMITVTATGTNGGAAPNYEFFVNGGSVQNGAATTYSSAFATGDAIVVLMTSTDPCLATDSVFSNSVTITVLPETNPAITITTNETTICEGDVVTFNSTTSGCNGDVSIDWLVNGAVVQSGLVDSFTTNVLSNGAQVSAVMNCSDPCANPAAATSNSITMNVTEISAEAGEGAVITQGQSYQLQGSGNGTYLWTPSATLDNSASADPTATPPVTTTYVLTVTNGDCQAFDEVTVVVNELVDPYNTFTPNGDGINDTWEIRNIEDYPDARVTVYSRWGQRVFTSTGYNAPWDGTNRGLALPAATYYYVIDLNGTGDAGNMQVTGSITLIK